MFTFFLEHVTAVTVSVKDKLNLSIGVAVGSSIVGPVIVYFTQKVTKRLYSKLLSSLFRMAQYNLFPMHILTVFFFFQRFIVTLGWILGKPLTLLFDPYQSIAMFLSGKWSLLPTHAFSLQSFFSQFSP